MLGLELFILFFEKLLSRTLTEDNGDNGCSMDILFKIRFMMQISIFNLWNVYNKSFL